MRRARELPKYGVLALIAAAVATLVFAAAPRALAQPDSNPGLDAGVAALEPHVVGGEPARITDFPYFVLLTDGAGSWQCGGTLIRQRWVLTAAHCVDGRRDDEVLAFLGYSTDIQSQVVQSSRIEVHPEYSIVYEDGSLVSLSNDVALVALSQLAQLGRPRIDVTGLGQSPSVPAVGSDQTTIGWGLTTIDGDLPDRLQKATVTIKRCDGSLLDERQDDYVCASGATTTACFGDSGGPLLRNDRVVGVFSYVSLDCSPAPSYGVYTRVSAVSDWVLDIVHARCQGKKATVHIGKGERPTHGPDVILGTPGNDVIDGLGGDDFICGGGGDDELFGGAGDDVVFGGGGADRLDGGIGDDRMEGRRGDDELFGGPGNDVVFGGGGADLLDGGIGDDRMEGRRGDDELFGGPGDDVLSGGAGRDLLDGGAGSDECRDRSGEDDLTRCQ